MSLRHYASGQRPSGVMQPIAAALDDAALADLAQYYAQLPAARGGAGVASPSAYEIERGRRIASEGVPQKGVPPCLACHGGKSAATFPRLDGQHAAYIAGQLRLWRRGLRGRTVHGAIMAAIARRLSDEQVEDVAAYFASVAASAPPAPAPPRAPARRR
jgi:cytochrome c553